MNIDINESTILKYVEKLTFHKIANLSKQINRKREEIYPTRKNEVKYGSLSKYLNIEEFKKIIQHENKSKVVLAYELMYNMGLRISEVVEIKREDIVKNELLIKNVKCKRIETLRIPSKILKKIKKHVKENIDLIKQNDNYIFYSENNNKTRYNISKDWLRNNWRELTKISNKKVVYGVSTHKDKKRELNLFSSHSLRHSFGQRIYNKCKDPELTRIAMRHKDIATTMTVYCRGEYEKVCNIIEELC
jgi:integrase